VELALVGYRMRITVEWANEPVADSVHPSERDLIRERLWAEAERRREAMRNRLGEASYFRLG